MLRHFVPLLRHLVALHSSFCVSLGLRQYFRFGLTWFDRACPGDLTALTGPDRAAHSLVRDFAADRYRQLKFSVSSELFYHKWPAL
jgi:hypothetical protein